MYLFLNGQSMNTPGCDGDPETHIPLSSFNSPHIGGSPVIGLYNGNIAEIIIFRDSLRDKDRQSIEAYLGKKWGIAVTQSGIPQ